MPTHTHYTHTLHTTHYTLHTPCCSDDLWLRSLFTMSHTFHCSTCNCFKKKLYLSFDSSFFTIKDDPLCNDQRLSSGNDTGNMGDIGDLHIIHFAINCSINPIGIENNFKLLQMKRQLNKSMVLICSVIQWSLAICIGHQPL